VEINTPVTITLGILTPFWFFYTFCFPS